MLVNYYLICIAQYPCSTELQDSAVHGLYKNIWPKCTVRSQPVCGLFQDQAELLCTSQGKRGQELTLLPIRLIDDHTLDTNLCNFPEDLPSHMLRRTAVIKLPPHASAVEVEH